MIIEFGIFQAEIIDPAVKGTLNVLRSCAKVPSVKRVVITSSMASVLYNGKSLTPDVVVDETWFSDPVVCENMKVSDIVLKLYIKLVCVSCSKFCSVSYVFFGLIIAFCSMCMQFQKL